MNHQRIQDELSAYLDKELSPSRHKQIEAHLHSCDECADILSAFQENRQMIANVAHSAPSTLKDGVMAKIHTQFQDELSAYLDNELVPAMRERLEAHLHSCSECSETLSVFQENRSRIKALEHPAPSSIENAVMAKIRQQAANPAIEEPTRTSWLPDIGRWIPDLGSLFSRPVTAAATGILTLALILSPLYFYLTAPQQEETLDLYVGLYTEQLEDNPLKSNVSTPLSATQTEESIVIEAADDIEQILDLYLEDVGN